MKNPNGYGSVVKLSGNRRKPYMAFKTVTVSEGDFIPPDIKKRLLSVSDAITDTSDIDVMEELIEIGREIVPLSEILKNTAEFLLAQDFKAVRKKKAIGYYKTMKEANIALAEANRDNISLAERLTFADVYKKAYDDAGIDGKSPGTVRNYHFGFQNCKEIHDTNIQDITAQMLQDVIDKRKGSSASTQRLMIKIMRLVMRFATSRDLCSKDFSQFLHVTEVADKSERTPFTIGEIEKLKLNGYDDIIYLIFTGMRISEYLGLPEDEAKNDVLHIKGTKNRTSDRLLPLHPELKSLNLKWKRCPYTTFRSHFKEAMRELGMKHTVHETRHTFATLARKYGVDDTMRKYMMGHITGSITDDVYTHPEMLVPELRSEMLKIQV